MGALEFTKRHQWALGSVVTALVVAEVVATAVLGMWASTFVTVGVVAAATVVVRCVVGTGGVLR